METHGHNRVASTHLLCSYLSRLTALLLLRVLQQRQGAYKKKIGSSLSSIAALTQCAEKYTPTKCPSRELLSVVCLLFLSRGPATTSANGFGPQGNSRPAQERWEGETNEDGQIKEHVS